MNAPEQLDLPCMVSQGPTTDGIGIVGRFAKAEAVFVKARGLDFPAVLVSALCAGTYCQVTAVVV